jgi:hypothetical protein
MHICRLVLLKMFLLRFSQEIRGQGMPALAAYKVQAGQVQGEPMSAADGAVHEIFQFRFHPLPKCADGFRNVIRDTQSGVLFAVDAAVKAAAGAAKGIVACFTNGTDPHMRPPVSTAVPGSGTGILSFVYFSTTGSGKQDVFTARF